MDDVRSLDRIAEQLDDIKRLLTSGFLHNGMSQRDVAKALGINQSSISRMFVSKRPKGRKTQSTSKRKA